MSSVLKTVNLHKKSDQRLAVKGRMYTKIHLLSDTNDRIVLKKKPVNKTAIFQGLKYAPASSPVLPIDIQSLNFESIEESGEVTFGGKAATGRRANRNIKRRTTNCRNDNNLVAEHN